jgi:hypothetical protein
LFESDGIHCLRGRGTDLHNRDCRVRCGYLRYAFAGNSKCGCCELCPAPNSMMPGWGEEGLLRLLPEFLFLL